jgi:integrase
MELKDIKRDEKGTWFFDINDIGSDSASDSPKSLKNRFSKRRIPVHPHLLELGIIEWRNRLEKAGHVRLFPELTYDPVKGYGKTSTKWFGSFLKRKFGWTRDGKRTFHSFRHTLITKCRNRHGIAEHELAQITGHGRGATVQSQVYTKDREPHDLLELIRDLDFGIGRIAPFDLDAGMEALTDALRRKSRGRGGESEQ